MGRLPAGDRVAAGQLAELVGRVREIVGTEWEQPAVGRPHVLPLCAAVVAVLESVLKTKNIDVDVPGATGGGSNLTTSRRFATGDELLADVANARVWAGLHYRFSTTAGVNLGKAVAKWDLDHFGKDDKHDK